MRRLALLGTLLAACGDGPIDLEDLDDELTDAFSDLYVSCGLIDDHATCRRLQQEADVDASLIAAVEAGTVIYDPDKARECLDSFGQSCERGQALASSTACDETFTGTVGANGPCAMDEQCKSRTCDVPSCPDACCQGTCVGDAPVPRPKLGDSCAQSSQCVDSYCDPTSATCLSYRAEGDACTSTAQCGTNVCANQMCTRRPAAGEACNANVAGGQCGHLGYTCSAASMTCVPAGLSGDPCTRQNDCADAYACVSGTCELGPMLGEACGELAGDCIDASFCNLSTMTCTARKPDGATCAGDDECQSDLCGDANTCVAEPVCI